MKRYVLQDSYSEFDVLDAMSILMRHPKIGDIGDARLRDKWIWANNVREWFLRHNNNWQWESY